MYERCNSMKRFAMKRLVEWKENPCRKPVIIEGANGVGKTWLVKEFGKEKYDVSVYIDFGSGDAELSRLFAKDLDIGHLVSGLKVYTGKEIDPPKTLIIFDNVQEMPKALLSLRYFYEDIQDYNVICVSSLMNIVLHDDFSILSDKVEILRLYPMSFHEFFSEMEQDEQLKTFLKTKNFTMMDIFRQNYIDDLKDYFFVGGMPEAVLQFVTYKDLGKVRDTQKQILERYDQFICEHSLYKFIPKIYTVWKSIPQQLLKENKKFVYDLIQEGGRAKFYEEEIMQLSNYGFVYRVDRLTEPRIPLKDYGGSKTFKLFMVDVGMLGCMLGLPQEMFFDKNSIFDAFQGALTEQYVIQQLVTVPD